MNTSLNGETHILSIYDTPSISVQPDVKKLEYSAVKCATESLNLTFFTKSFDMNVVDIPLSELVVVICCQELDNIEKIIGTDLFKRVFKYILTDNGGEFQRPDELETSVDGSKRCCIYYCEANRSDQKAKVEKNHEYIRYIIPKGTSMDNYTQSDIDLMMSHINSTAREVLNFAIPYDMASIYLGMDSMKKLNLSKIQPDDIILKPYLINKKK